MSSCYCWLALVSQINSYTLMHDSTTAHTRPHSSFPLHVAYGLFMFTIAVFNGAKYYIEVGPYLFIAQPQ